MIELSLLPVPQSIATLDYEVIRQEMMALLTQLMTQYGVAYDISQLEANPPSIIIRSAAYRELLLRADINTAVKSRLVAFATTGDLDHLAAYYDVVRMIGEDDGRLRRRIMLATSGRSTAGPKEWYIAAALRSDIRVKDASIFRGQYMPDLTLSVVSTDNGGIADAALLAAVNTEIQKDSVRVISDRITVIAATQIVANIQAQIWLLPTTPQSVFDGLATALRDAHNAESGLGFDLKRSWIESRLHQAGVARVNLLAPSADFVVNDNHTAAIGTIDLIDMGRDR